ncbi:unnamed protein product [Gongylonema pulchrum]|uniref:Uncharacterized protein n=1 Tax=Gongylonema pulchrum TaxID=637853 RepID=A0A3P7P4D4_9BILA|nr:unnamed protein product [Gongylonema pulchrum]
MEESQVCGTWFAGGIALFRRRLTFASREQQLAASVTVDTVSSLGFCGLPVLQTWQTSYCSYHSAQMPNQGLPQAGNGDAPDPRNGQAGGFGGGNRFERGNRGGARGGRNANGNFRG